jgi:hypothetical protein
MSVQIRIDCPDHDNVLAKVFKADITPDELQMVVGRLCRAAEESLRESMIEHSRTGMTIESIQSWDLEISNDRVMMATGSLTRGAQLYWLDQGRREVRPINARFLHYFTWPEQIEMFSRYSAATLGTGLVRRAGLDALMQSSIIIEEFITEKT